MMPAMADGGTGAKAFPTETERWAALEARDRRADGAFFYAVQTTGVYCRPSCGARLAKRRNVSFFPSPAAAEAAGFRPCKRCRPDVAATDPHDRAVALACRLIETGETPPDLAELAGASGLSRFHFHRIFKAKTGVTPMQYAAGWRARRARDELGKTSTVTEAIYAAGYGSSSRFYASAAARLGMTPRRLRSGGKGEAMQFATTPCSLGAILVAATEKGISAISFGDDAATLERDLYRRFPDAAIRPGDAEFRSLVERVVEAVETPESGLDLPLDIQGTAFQQRVWQALRAIPPGTTKSYAEIARDIGRPRAVRAVAAAIAANRIAFLIPCHRAIHTDGTAGGYHWGSQRKRALLAREAPKCGLFAREAMK